MIELFNEGVNSTPTNSVHNTLYVEKFEEVFFGVYEFELNGNAVIAESVGEYFGDPIVSIPVQSGNSNCVAPFLLKVGEQRAEFSEENNIFVEKVIEEPDLNQVVEAVKLEVDKNRDVNISYTVDKDDIIADLREVVKEDVDSYKADGQAAIDKLRLDNSAIIDEVDRIRDSIFLEFADTVDSFRAKETGKLQKFVDKKIAEIRKTNKHLAEKVENDTRDTLASTYTDFVRKLRETQIELKERQKEHKKLSSSVNILEKSHIELQDEINLNRLDINEATKASEKNVNRALSRLGTVKKELTDAKREFDTLKEAWANEVSVEEVVAIRESAEEHVKEFYQNKIEQVEEAHIDKLKKEEIFEAINKSKESILDDIKASGILKREVRKLANEVVSKLSTEDQITETEVRKIASETVLLTVDEDRDTRITEEDVQKIVDEAVLKVTTNQPITESKDLDPADRKQLQESLKIELDSRFTAEMASIKRMVELTGGGGTNAVQYKNGGTMEGNLNVTGDILSGGVNLYDIFGTGSGGGGSDVSGLSGNWQSTYETVAALSSSWTPTSGSEVTGTGTAGVIPVWETSTSLTDSIILSTDGTTLDANGEFRAGSFYTSSVTTTSAVDFNISTDGFTVSAGQMAWNPIDFTVDLGVNDNVTLQVGQEQLMHVKGGANETIRNGMVVYAGGTIGGSDLIGVSAWSSDAGFQDEVYMIGLATEELTGNVDGFVTTFGRVRGLDGNEFSSGGIREDGTPAWSVGEILYPSQSLSARGTLTNIEPISPNLAVPVAWVTKVPSISNVTLTVRANGAAGESLHGLHDVRFDLPVEDGSLLSYNDSLSVWQNVVDIGITSLSTSGDILSSGVNLYDIFGTGGGTGEVGPGTTGTIAVFDSVSSISDSIMTESGDTLSINGNIADVVTIGLSSSTGTTVISGGVEGLVVPSLKSYGDSTIFGDLSVLGDMVYLDTTVSVTSALSVVNHGSGPAIYGEQAGVGQPIAKFVDSEGGLVTIGDGGSITASGDVTGTNISTLTNNVSALYAYLVQNFDSNTLVGATDITDFVNNYPKTGLDPGDVITLSATNIAYILGSNDGSSLTDWFEVNLKPNFLFYKQGVSDYAVLDVLPLSSAKSSKYIIEVEDTTDGAIFYGEVNVVSDGTIAVATEYALNHTTVFPFVEFGAEVITSSHIQLSAIALEGKTMGDFIFKGNRSNLFG